eukprot:GDKH01021703.1.p1 GENE.GDKH01021703.1~~GDKH01021703.1.p1  ORF type:complete len:255 (+),score=42.35 GDKH01021703.1:114-878(+)
MAFPVSRPCFLLLGDSITQWGFAPGGWVGRLAEKYQRKADILARGYAGYNTDMFLKIAPHVLRDVQKFGSIPLVTLFLGANDAALPPAPEFGGSAFPNQTVELNQYGENIEKLVAQVREAVGEARILLITPPPVNDVAFIEFMREVQPNAAHLITKSNRNLEQATLYAERCKSVAERLGLPVVDLCSELQQTTVDGGWKSLLSDGLHLSEEGQRVVFEAVSTAIVRHHPELDPDRMAWDVPTWREFEKKWAPPV